jgi:hypothetical protein
MVEDSSSGRIVVSSHRHWFGDQRLSSWSVTLDGKVVGKLLPEGNVNLRCEAGAHVVRIRQWWYRSRPTEVHVTDGQTVNLVADIPREGSIVGRMFFFIVAPGRALSLTEIR